MSQLLHVNNYDTQFNMKDYLYYSQNTHNAIENFRDLLIEENHQTHSKEPTLDNEKETTFLESDNFLLRDESPGYPEDQLLFSVVNGELQPLTSPFMVPGIYKKISTPITTNVNNTNKLENKIPNVYLSDKESCGRVITNTDFKKLYICVDTETVNKIESSGGTRKVIPLKNTDNGQLNGKTSPTNEGSEQIKYNTETNTLDALTKLAQNILTLSTEDHVVIDRHRKEIIRTDNDTNQKTIYRMMTPENQEVQPTMKTKKRAARNSQPIKLKLGRPRKINNQIDMESTKKPQPENADELKKVEPVVTSFSDEHLKVRTRFGRLVKTSIPLKRDGEIRKTPLLPVRSLIKELKDRDYKNSKIDRAFIESKKKETELKDMKTMETNNISEPVKLRTFPPEAHCPTCNKIFLGRRLQTHFAQHPSHLQSAVNTNNVNGNGKQCISSSTQTEDISLFRFLITKLQKSYLNEDQRADIFLNEINDFVKQLQLRSSRLIENTSGLHFVTAHTARVLGIPEGHYALDMNAMEEPEPPQLEPDTNTLMNCCSSSEVHVRSLDYTQLSMSIDNTITDEAAQKLNLSIGGKLLPPSEETLLRVVDDLLPESIKDLNGNRSKTTKVLIPHYDQVSDNAVEALTMKESDQRVRAIEQEGSLDLAVDFFQFANNNN